MANMLEVAFRGVGTEVYTHRVHSIEVNNDGKLVMDKVGDNDTTIIADPEEFLGIVTTLTF